MTNPYHDEYGRFCSKEEMKEIVDQLGKMVANQKAGRGKALSEGEHAQEIFDRWVEMKSAYEKASSPSDPDRFPTKSELKDVRHRVAQKRRESVIDSLGWDSSSSEAAKQLDDYLAAARSGSPDSARLREDIVDSMSWSETLSEGRMGPARAEEALAAYEAAVKSDRADVISRFNQNIAALKPDAKLQAAVVAASDFADTTSDDWAQHMLAKAHGDDPKAAREAARQLRQHQQAIARKNFFADVQETLHEHAELDASRWKLLEQSIVRWEQGRAQGLFSADLHFTYESQRHFNVVYTVEVNTVEGCVAVIAKNATTRPVPKAAQASVARAQESLQASAKQWLDERKYIQRADLKELYAD